MAAVAFNKYCGVGIAYNASIGGESLQTQSTQIRKYTNTQIQKYKNIQNTKMQCKSRRWVCNVCWFVMLIFNFEGRAVDNLSIWSNLSKPGLPKLDNLVCAFTSLLKTSWRRGGKIQDALKNFVEKLPHLENAGKNAILFSTNIMLKTPWRRGGKI